MSKSKNMSNSLSLKELEYFYVKLFNGKCMTPLLIHPIALFASRKAIICTVPFTKGVMMFKEPIKKG